MGNLKRSNVFTLGIDGGGSKTMAVVVDEQGQEVGRAQTGSANFGIVGLKKALEHMRGAAEEAAAMAGCRLPLQGAWIGVPGLDRPEDVVLFDPLLDMAEIVRITNDVDLVLCALDHNVGVALIAGTGSIVLGQDTRGNMARSSGWGHLIGDEGSGYDIGRQALQAAVRFADGRGPRTVLLERILQHWQLNKAEDILGVLNAGCDNARIARLSRCVFDAAREGDVIAGEIVQQAARELALAVTTVSGLLSFPRNQVPLALGGSILIHEHAFREKVLHHIRSRQTIGSVVIADQPALSAARAILSSIS